MTKVSINDRNESEVKRDLIESTALEKTALAELIDAEAERLKKIAELEGITVDKLIELQESISTILDTGVKLQELLQTDLEFANQKMENDCDSEVMKVKEEISEVEEDGTKKVEKVITKEKEE